MKPLKILIACEYSGVVREAFRARGHDAVSCDLLPSEQPGPHYQGDVRDILGNGWDMVIAFPPCTYLCNSGVRWLHERAGRWEQMREAAAFFRLFLETTAAPRVAIENPLMHRHAREIIQAPYSQIIQPYEFGHGETKATCLWLRGLPPLMSTLAVPGRVARIHKMPGGPNQGKERSRTFPGIAAAFAEQWT